MCAADKTLEEFQEELSITEQKQDKDIRCLGQTAICKVLWEGMASCQFGMLELQQRGFVVVLLNSKGAGTRVIAEYCILQNSCFQISLLYRCFTNCHQASSEMSYKELTACSHSTPCNSRLSKHEPTVLQKCKKDFQKGFLQLCKTRC